MQRLWIAFAVPGLMLALAGCGAEDEVIAVEAVERTGFYAEVDALPLAEQAVQWAYAGHVAEMKKVLAKDEKLVNAVVGEFTPLTAAVANDSRDMVNYLLEQGADPNLATTQGTPLALAEMVEADVKIIDALKASGAR